MTAPRQTGTSDDLLVTRRQALTVGIAATVTVMCLLPLKATAAQRFRRLDEDLYVFPAEQPGRVTLLVTGNVGPTETRFHIGSAVHAVQTSLASQNATLEVASQDLVAEPIWAERLSVGSRRRIASPFLAALLAEDMSLGTLYDQGSPGTDHRTLMAPLARAIEARVRRSGFHSDPQAYGRRLAATLLPDVLRFDPARPVGFTFAARNGRHPSDAHSVVVSSILNGSVPDPSPLEAIHVASL